MADVVDEVVSNNIFSVEGLINNAPIVSVLGAVLFFVVGIFRPTWFSKNIPFYVLVQACLSNSAPYNALRDLQVLACRLELFSSIFVPTLKVKLAMGGVK